MRENEQKKEQRQIGHLGYKSMPGDPLYQQPHNPLAAKIEKQDGRKFKKGKYLGSAKKKPNQKWQWMDRLRQFYVFVGPRG